MMNVFKKQKERLMEMNRWTMEQGDLLPNRVQLSTDHSWGVLWDPGDKQGEGGISNRFEDISQQRRDSPGMQSLSHCCIQLLQPYSGNPRQPLQGWEWHEDGAH